MAPSLGLSLESFQILSWWHLWLGELRFHVFLMAGFAWLEEHARGDPILLSSASVFASRARFRSEANSLMCGIAQGCLHRVVFVMVRLRLFVSFVWKRVRGFPLSSLFPLSLPLQMPTCWRPRFSLRGKFGWLVRLRKCHPFRGAGVVVGSWVIGPLWLYVWLIVLDVFFVFLFLCQLPPALLGLIS